MVDNQESKGKITSVHLNSEYDLGECIFNADHGELHSKTTDQFLHIEKKVAQVFQCLAKAEGEIVTREEIFSQVWPNLIVSDDSLNRCISVLRKKLKSFGHGVMIKTHPKIGFNLVYPHTNPESSLRTKQENISSINATISQPKSPLVKPPKHYLTSIVFILTIAIIYWLIPVNRPASESIASLKTTELDHYRNIIMPFSISKDLYDKYHMLDSKFRQIITNHPNHYTIEQSELTNFLSAPSTQVGKHFNARFVIKANIYQEGSREIINWRMVDAKTGDEIVNQQINLALNSLEMNVRVLASEFIAANANICFLDDKPAHINYILTSANYLFSPDSSQEFHRPIIKLLAQTLTSVDPNSIPTMLLLAKFIGATHWTTKERSYAYIDLAIKTLRKAINLAPKHSESYRALAHIYMLRYQWHDAYKALLSVQRLALSDNKASALAMLPLYRATSQVTKSLLNLKIQQHLSSPTDTDKMLELVMLHIEQGSFLKAITLAKSMPIDANERGALKTILGPIFIAMGDEEKGKELTIEGYRTLGVAPQYTQVLLQGLQHQQSKKQASEFLTQASQNGAFPKTVLLQMYEQLEQIDAYYQLAFTLAKSYQYDINTSMRYHAHTIRQHPSFSTLMTEINLVNYWSGNGVPTFCQNKNITDCL